MFNIYSKLNEELKEITVKYFSDKDGIILKGAILLYNIEVESKSDIIRYSQDVDYTNNNSVSKNRIKEYCDGLFDRLQIKAKEYDVILESMEDIKTISRPSSYCINYIDSRTKRKIFNIDFSMSNESYKNGCNYTLYNTGNIYGYDINKIYSDKMMNISSKTFYLRIKDYVDLYYMSYIKTKELYINRIIEFNNLNRDKELGDFTTIIGKEKRILELLGSDDMAIDFKNIDIQENIKYVNSRVIEFVLPFLPFSDINTYKNTVWSVDSGR